MSGNKDKKVSKRKSRGFTIVCENDLPPGLLERALADIYAKKVRNGTLKTELANDKAGTPA